MPCFQKKKTTVNWAQFNNEYRENKFGDSGDFGDQIRRKEKHTGERSQ